MSVVSTGQISIVDVNDGSSVYTAAIYKQSLTQPTAPTGGSYNFSTNVITPPSGWTATPPSATTTPTWVSSYTFATSDKTTPVTASTWGVPTIFSQKGDPGATAKTLTLICDRQIISFDATGTANPAVQTVTFSVIKQNTTATVSWSMTDMASPTPNGVTGQLSATSGDSVTMTVAQFNAARGSTPGVVVTAALVDGGVTLSASINIVKAADGTNGTNGTNAITTVLSNPFHLFPASSTGAISTYTGSGTLVSVYDGITQLTSIGSGTASSNGTFGITSVTVSPSTDLTVGSITVSGNSASIPYSSNTTSDSFVTSSATIAINGKTSSGNAFTTSVIQRFGKSKQGNLGPTVTITSNNSLAFTSTNNVLDSGQADITLTANTLNMTGQTYTWSFSGFQTSPTNSGASTQTITAAQFGTAKSATVTITVSYNGGTYTDVVSIVRLENNPAVKILPNNPLSYNSTDGVLDSGQSDIILTATTASMTGQTYAWTFSGFQTSPTNSGASTQTVTAAQFGTAKSATVTVTVTYNSLSFVDTVTIVRNEKSTAVAGATKNQTFYQNYDPTTEGNNGDSWYNSTTQLLWYKANGTWAKVLPTITNSNVTTFFSNAAIGNAQIGNLSAGKITTGTISASTDITVGTSSEGLQISGTNKTIDAQVGFSISQFNFTSWWVPSCYINSADNYTIIMHGPPYYYGMIEVGHYAVIEQTWLNFGTYQVFAYVNSYTATSISFDRNVFYNFGEGYPYSVTVSGNVFNITGTVTGPSLQIGSVVKYNGYNIQLILGSNNIWFTYPDASFIRTTSPLIITGGSSSGSINRVRFGQLSNTKYGIEGFDTNSNSLFKLDETGLTAKITESSINSVSGSYNFPVVAKGNVQLTLSGSNTTTVLIPTTTTSCLRFLIQVTGYYQNAIPGTASASNMKLFSVGLHYNRATSSWSLLGPTSISALHTDLTNFSSSKIDAVLSGDKIQLTLDSRNSQPVGAKTTYSYIVWAMDNAAYPVFSVY